jgi:hypothetical protein
MAQAEGVTVLRRILARWAVTIYTTIMVVGILAAVILGRT